MDFSTAFRFFTEDDTWKRNFGIAALLSGILAILDLIPDYTDYIMWVSGADLRLLIRILLIPLVLLFSCAMYGYSLDIARNIRDGDGHSLPRWSLISQSMQGLMLTLALIIYIFPLGLLLMVGVTAVVDFDLINFQINPDSMAFTLTLLIGGTLLTGLITFFMGALQVNYIRRNTFDSCFQIKNISFIIRKCWRKLLLLVMLSCAVYLFSATISFVLPHSHGRSIALTFIELTLTPLMIFVTGHLYGQIASFVDLDKLNQAYGVG